MIVQAILFYIFAVVAVASGVLVVSSSNPVHSVLFLILAFFNTAGMFILIGAEFLAMILVIVYVGAVAVLFLFVVMMLDIDFLQLRSGFVRYLPIGAVGRVDLVGRAHPCRRELGHAIAQQGASGAVASATGGLPLTNTRALGDILYTRYLFALSGGGADSARRDDRGDRADLAPSLRCETAIDRRPSSPAPAPTRSRS